MAGEVLSKAYQELLKDLKQRIRTARVRAALMVNRELVLLYWHIGQAILRRQAKEGWGAKVIDRLAEDRRQEFPDMKGFSPRNPKYMRAFAEAYSDEQFVQQVAAQTRFIGTATCSPRVAMSAGRYGRTMASLSRRRYSSSWPTCVSRPRRRERWTRPSPATSPTWGS